MALHTCYLRQNSEEHVHTFFLEKNDLFLKSFQDHKSREIINLSMFLLTIPHVPLMEKTKMNHLQQTTLCQDVVHQYKENVEDRHRNVYK